LTGRRLAKSVAVFGLSFLLAFSSSLGNISAKATSLDNLKKQQASLQQKGKELDKQLAKLKNNKAKKQQYKNTLDEKAVNIEQQIDSENRQIASLDASIKQKESAIADKQKMVDTDFQKLKNRVCAIYMTGEASNLEVVLNAKNVMDLADKTEVLQMVSEHDTKLINTLKTDLDSIMAQKAEIEKNRLQSTKAKTTLEQQEKQLSDLSGEAAADLGSMDKNRKSIEAAQAENAKETARISQRISKSGGKYVKRFPAVLEEAKKYLGYPYVWGGGSPRTSFDCSGYVSWVLNHSGWNIGRRGVDGLYALCTPVSSSSAMAGDLVFYDYTYGGLPRSHVGIYVGNGKAIQCDSSGVEYVRLSNSYWRRHFDCFGRLQ
jgi:cell wall-associated NlpC family hydrolase